MLSLSDWVLVGTSLFLGAVALFVPYFAELVKRRFFAPSLKLSFEQKPPACLQTFWGSASDPALHEPVFFLRFQISNEGKSQAKLIEVILEELWVFDAASKPQKLPSFSPVNLRYDEIGSRNINLNPKRKIYWAIGHISSPRYQATGEQRIRIDVPGRDKKALAFLLEMLEYPFGQPNSLAPGRYGLKVSVYSENARTESISLILDWSGKWQDTDSDMFREVVLTQVTQIS